MTTPENDPKQRRLDDATAERLAKLRALPVDTSRLREFVEAKLPRPQKRVPASFLGRFSLRVAVASFLVIGSLIAVVIYASGRPVLASSERLAQVHEEVLVGGGSHHMEVNSVESANAFLVSQWHDAPVIPQLPKDHVSSCCIHNLGRKRIVCICFETDGVPITMAVATAADVSLPASQVVTSGGITYQIQSSGQINMVMSQRGGRWICLMGKMPTDRLVGLAGTLRL